MSVKKNPAKKTSAVKSKTRQSATAKSRKSSKARSSAAVKAIKKPKPSARMTKEPVGKPEKETKIIVSQEVKEKIEKAELLKRPRKAAKKPAISLPPLPPIEVSQHPKNKVKHILVSQPKPVDMDRNPYIELAKKHGLKVTFRQFISVQGLSAQEFRTQRIDILEHGAVILTSKLAVDHYFRICNEMRITVPETMKYFCINEQTAYYLQKYIQYRKRKIFFGHGTISDLVDVIRKNKAEKFLLPASDVQKEQIADFLQEVNITFTKATFYKTVAANLSDMKSLDDYDVLVFFTPVGIRSLKQNFPGFRQGNTRIAAFGHTTAQMVKALNYRLDIFAPNPQNPSMTGALDAYIKEANRR